MTRAVVSILGGAALALAAADARAGGLARPISGSPASSGLAGAFGAIADDASCLHVNPGGCGLADVGALVSLELVVAPRSYVPIDADGNRGASQDATAVAPAPVIGVLFKPGDADSPVTLGVGAWNSYGGILSWERTGTPGAINGSTDLVFEVGLGASWAITDRVALGVTGRVGVGLFAVDATQKPVDTDLSASGLGLGLATGILVRPTDQLSVGLSWRSNLNVTTSGSGTLTLPQGPTDVDAEHVQRWPQSASLAVAYRASDALLLAGQVDWTQWSRFEVLHIHFPGMDGLDQRFDLDWSDTVSVRAGAQYAMSETVTLRGGAVFDGNAVPDRTIERQYLDSPKFGGALGGTFGLSRRVALDVALTVIAGPPRTVPDNSADRPDTFPTWRENLAPGEHAGQVLTLATGVRISL